MDIVEKIMSMIAFSGEGRLYSTNAIRKAQEGGFEEAQELLSKCEESLLKAHQAHTELLAYEAQGNSLEVSLLMVHGAEHLSNAEVIFEISKEFIIMYKVVKNNENL
jgi:Phosphotransferase system cellobiose-specific component IIA